MTGPTGHSAFGASSAHRWTECPGSIGAQAGLENKSGAAAREGTALHAVVADALEKGKEAAEYIGEPFWYEDHGDECCIRISMDQSDAVQLCLDVVRQERDDIEGHLSLETRFHLTEIDPEFFGTCDCVLRADHEGAPHTVVDFKFGHNLVEVRDERGRINKQLGYYAIGAGALEHGAEIVIIQPRAYHPEGPVRRTFATAEELSSLAQELARGARLARMQFAPRKAGKWCQYCRAAGSCAALRAFSYQQSSLTWDDDTPNVPEIKDGRVHALQRVLNAADVIEEYIKAARVYAFDLIGAGLEVPGYAIKDKRPTRKWIDEDEAWDFLTAELGLAESAIEHYTMSSVAQVEKLLKAPDRARLKDYWEAESSGRRLVKVGGASAAKLPLPSPTTTFDALPTDHEGN